MANAVYPKYKEALLGGDSNIALDSGTVKAALVDTDGYTYSAAHDFYDDVSANVVGTPVEITSKTITNGLFDGANVEFNNVTGTSVEGLIIYIDTGTPGTSRLVAYIDTGITGLPVTPADDDVLIEWNAGGIFQL